MLLQLIIGVALQAAASSTPSPIVDRVNGWIISDARGWCAADTTYDGGVTVYIGYICGTNRVWFSMGNPAWESIQQGASYNLTVRFDNGSTYTRANATGIRQDTSNGRLTSVIMPMNGDEFLSDFAGASSVAITMGEHRVASLNLDGTRAVAQRLLRCSIESHRRYPPDPFASVTPMPEGASRPPAPTTSNPPVLRTRPNRGDSGIGPPPPVTSANPSRVWVQLAVGNNRPALAYQFGAFRVQAAALLSNRVAYTTRLNATNRLLVGPFANESAARAFISQLALSGVQAYTWTSEAGQEIQLLRND
jgi:hypothetical protein